MQSLMTGPNLFERDSDPSGFASAHCRSFATGCLSRRALTRQLSVHKVCCNPRDMSLTAWRKGFCSRLWGGWRASRISHRSRDFSGNALSRLTHKAYRRRSRSEFRYAATFVVFRAVSRGVVIFIAATLRYMRHRRTVSSRTLKASAMRGLVHPDNVSNIARARSASPRSREWANVSSALRCWSPAVTRDLPATPRLRESTRRSNHTCDSLVKLRESALAS